jgi:integrase
MPTKTAASTTTETSTKFIEQFVREAVATSLAASPYDEATLRTVTRRLCRWAADEALPIDVSLFQPSLIERHIIHGLPNYIWASRSNVRSILLRMSEALLGERAARIRHLPIGPSSASEPFTADESATVRAWASAQKLSRRTSAAALVGLGAGAGISAGELTAMKVGDVAEDGSTVTVRQGRSRTVVVDRRYRALVKRAVTGRGPDEWIFSPHRRVAGKNLVSGFVAHNPCESVAINSRRLRATWIVEQLRAGVSPIELRAASGVESLSALDRFLRYAA